MKFTKVFCNSSGKTTKNVKCRVKPVSRYDSVFSYESEFIRPTNSIMSSLKMSHKNLLGGNFRQVMNIRDIDVCRLNQIMKRVQFMKELFNFGNATFGGAIHDCPYEGKFKIVNASVGSVSNSGAQEKFMAFQNFPNGIYRFQIHSYNKRDENIGIITLFVELKDRAKVLSNDEEF